MTQWYAKEMQTKQKKSQKYIYTYRFTNNTSKEKQKRNNQKTIHQKTSDIQPTENIKPKPTKPTYTTYTHKKHIDVMINSPYTQTPQTIFLGVMYMYVLCERVWNIWQKHTHWNHNIERKMWVCTKFSVFVDYDEYYLRLWLWSVDDEYCAAIGSIGPTWSSYATRKRNREKPAHYNNNNNNHKKDKKLKHY